MNAYLAPDGETRGGSGCVLRSRALQVPMARRRGNRQGRGVLRERDDESRWRTELDDANNSATCGGGGGDGGSGGGSWVGGEV